MILKIIHINIKPLYMNLHLYIKYLEKNAKKFERTFQNDSKP